MVSQCNVIHVLYTHYIYMFRELIASIFVSHVVAVAAASSCVSVQFFDCFVAIENENKHELICQWLCCTGKQLSEKEVNHKEIRLHIYIYI